jgi:hypothetical protein
MPCTQISTSLLSRTSRATRVFAMQAGGSSLRSTRQMPRGQLLKESCMLTGQSMANISLQLPTNLLLPLRFVQDTNMRALANSIARIYLTPRIARMYIL